MGRRLVGDVQVAGGTLPEKGTWEERPRVGRGQSQNMWARAFAMNSQAKVWALGERGTEGVEREAAGDQDC